MTPRPFTVCYVRRHDRTLVRYPARFGSLPAAQACDAVRTADAFAIASEDAGIVEAHGLTAEQLRDVALLCVSRATRERLQREAFVAAMAASAQAARQRAACAGEGVPRMAVALLLDAAEKLERAARAASAAPESTGTAP